MSDRRRFLLNGFKTLGFAMASPLWIEQAMASISKTQPQFFVVLQIPQAMDCTLGLDPMTHAESKTTSSDVYLDYRPQDILQARGMRLGPSASPLLRYADQIAVINGIQMRVDQGHNTNYIASGSMTGDSANLGAEFANNILARGARLPYDIIANSQVDTGQYGLVVGSTSNSSDMYGQQKEILQGLQSGYRGQSWGNLAQSRLNLSAMEEKFNKVKSDFAGSSTDASVIGLASALVSGMSRTGVLTLDFSLDSHTDYKNEHKSEQMKAWAVVADTFDLFKKIPFNLGSLFDATTFMVVTEFSRTPFLNSSGNGKDHNILTNSIVFAGRGVKGGTVSGRSRVYSEAYKKQHGFASISGSNGQRADHVGLPIDYRDGTVVTDLNEAKNRGLQNVSNVYPENVAATALQILGIDSKELPHLAHYREIPNVKKA